MIFSILLVLSTWLHIFSYGLKFRLNFGHVFFLSMLILRNIGVVEAIIFILVSEYYPRFANTDVDLKSLILVPIEILLVLSLLIIKVEIVKIGIVLAIICHIISFIVAKTLGDTLVEIMEEIGVSFVMNIVYFVSLSGPMITLVSMVVR